MSKQRLCHICRKHPAIIETIPCKIGDTEEYERWITIDAIECDEEVFIALRNTIDQMREKLEAIKNKGDWDGDYYIFTKTLTHPCEICQKAQEKQHYIKTALPKHLIEVGVDRLYFEASLRDCNPIIREYQDKSLFLYGDTGVGKTHAAVALLREDVKNKKYVVFITTFDLLQKIKATFSQSGNNQNEQQIIEYYSTIPNLYLDDISAEKPTDWSLAVLCGIIDMRYKKMLRTIFTANLNPAELSIFLGDRIVSRILGICGTPVKLNGEDRRLPDK